MRKILLIGLLLICITNAYSQWQKIDLPKGITVNKLYKSNDKLFAGTSNGVYQLVSGKWTKLSEDVNFSITCLLDYNNYLFAGTASNGLYRSGDGGSSWVKLVNNFTPTQIHDIKLYKNYIAVGTFDGLFMSDDNGLQWTNKSGNLANKNIKAILTFNDSLLIGGPYGVFMSSDTAKVWKPKNIWTGSKEVNALVSANTKLFISIINGGALMSDDMGKSWTKVNTGLTNPKVQTLSYQNNYLFAGTSDSLYLATDLTNVIWKTLSLKQSPEEVLTIEELNNSLIVGNSYGVFTQPYEAFSENKPFEILNEGFPEITFSKLYTLDTLVVSSTNKGIWNYDTKSKSWSYGHIFPTYSMDGFIQYKDTTRLMFNPTGLYASSANLKIWKKICTRTDITCFAVLDTVIFLGTTENGVFRSKDFGNSWVPVNIGLSPLTVKAIVANNSYLYVYSGTNDYYVSTNSGDEWKDLETLFPTNLNDMISFQNNVFCVGQIDHRTVGSGTRIYSNSGNLDNFISNDSSFINYHNFHNSFMKLHAVGNTLFAGSEYAGLYISTDKGKNWSQINKGLNYHKALYSGDLDRSYPKILQLTSRGDSTLYFLNDSNQIYFRKFSDILVPASPSNLVVKLDTVNYENYKLTFKWTRLNNPNVTEYVLLKNKEVVSYKAAPRDTLQSIVNKLGWWYIGNGYNYKDEIVRYRLVASAGGDFSLPSNYGSVVTQIINSNKDIDNLDYSVYPNPVSDNLYIKIGKGQGKNIKAKISNSSGMVIHEEILSDEINSIDLSKFMKGLYLLEITNSQKESKQIKLIKD